MTNNELQNGTKPLILGLFGFGVVGEGLYKVLQKTTSLNTRIKKVCIKHPEKKRDAPEELFTTQADELLNDPEINVIVEMIDDADAAYQIVTTALTNKKQVVSASKKMIGEHLQALIDMQQAHGTSFLYEAAACASIPVIRNLEEYYDNDLLAAFQAVVNGSTNYILTKMFEEGLEYYEALLQAQQLGFAESNPALDVEGVDAINKLVILLVHAYGIVALPNNLLYTGIQNINAADAKTAAEKGLQIRLVAQARKTAGNKIAAFVLPQFVRKDNPLYNVRNEYNGVVIKSSFSDEQFFYGKGAGSFPTASAVLSDISALRYEYKYEYKKRFHYQPPQLTNDYYLKVYVSFRSLKTIPKDQFEWLEEWHSNEEGGYLVGVLHVRHLLESDWWKQNDNSLILTSDPFIDNMELRQLRKKSLELAGVVV
jgi:homoserine dehydrogenase